MATILVVDENSIERRILRMTLEVDGNRVAEASTGAEALELIRGYEIDLVFLTMDMQEMDGKTLIEKARAIPERAATRFVAVLQPDDEKGPVESFMHGVSDIVIRPFGAPDLRNIVERWTSAEQIDLRERLVEVQLDAYETGRQLQEEVRARTS